MFYNDSVSGFSKKCERKLCYDRYSKRYVIKGIDGKDGKDGLNGQDGQDGEDGNIVVNEPTADSLEEMLDKMNGCWEGESFAINDICEDLVHVDSELKLYCGFNGDLRGSLSYSIKNDRVGFDHENNTITGDKEYLVGFYNSETKEFELVETKENGIYRGKISDDKSICLTQSQAPQNSVNPKYVSSIRKLSKKSDFGYTINQLREELKGSEPEPEPEPAPPPACSYWSISPVPESETVIQFTSNSPVTTIDDANGNSYTFSATPVGSIGAGIAGDYQIRFTDSEYASSSNIDYNNYVDEGTNSKSIFPIWVNDGTTDSTIKISADTQSNQFPYQTTYTESGITYTLELFLGEGEPCPEPEPEPESTIALGSGESEPEPESETMCPTSNTGYIYCMNSNKIKDSEEHGYPFYYKNGNTVSSVEIKNIIFKGQDVSGDFFKYRIDENNGSGYVQGEDTYFTVCPETISFIAGSDNQGVYIYISDEFYFTDIIVDGETIT